MEFNEENEYRIVALSNRHSINEPGDVRPTKKIHFRSRPDGSITPYIALFEGLRKRLPIKSVIVGPHPERENQRVAVELLLERCGVEANVRVSEIPLRI
jgi:hypothetical protein